MRKKITNPLRKQSLKFKFTVEGETEKWYLEWLQSEMNKQLKTDNSDYGVDFVVDIILPHRKARYAKPQDKFVHVCDYEGNIPSDIKRFEEILKSIKNAKQEKMIDYQLAYSNPTFEYWLILHRTSSLCAYKGLSQINKFFGTNFKSLDEYKKESNFKRILTQLSLEDVKSAIRHAEKQAMENKKDTVRSKPIKKSGISYFSNPPATSLHGYISKIFKECDISWK